MRLPWETCSVIFTIYRNYDSIIIQITRGRGRMPAIRPITELRNNSNEIAEFCKTTQEPVFITKNGSNKTYFV